MLRTTSFVLLLLWQILGGLASFSRVNLETVNLSIARQTLTAQVRVLDQNQKALAQITDGDRIHLQVLLSQKISEKVEVNFRLEGLDAQVGNCTVAAGQDGCLTQPLDAFGWYWNPGGTAQPARSVLAVAGGVTLGQSDRVSVRPRPVVMVHGFISSWQAWQTYLGPDGYLASVGIAGFAVGDGQAAGVLNTGSITDPAGRTNTIAENAAVLKQYVSRVKELTGAQKVDLLVHSMGGLISRYYIDRLMAERDVAQLIMLGTPQNGTECAYLPASLGFYLPASLEIRPSYIQGLYNQQILHRHGVQFYALAGIPIIEAFKSPCTTVPSDIAVSLESANGLPLTLREIALLHTDLNASKQAFQEFILPLLQKIPPDFTPEADPPGLSTSGAVQQFTKVYHGHLDAGSSQEFTIPIEAGVTVASFALYDTSRSLEVSVVGASGKEIELSVEKNGLVVIDDPSSLVYLGYGFANPKAGLWKVTLHTTEKTPPQGADFALSARFEGGARLTAQANPTLPRPGETVQISLQLDLAGQELPLQQAVAQIRGSDGALETLELSIQGGKAQGSWRPTRSGLYGIDLEVLAAAPQDALPAGARIERAAFLTAEVQPQEDRRRSLLNLALVLAGVVLGVWAAAWLARIAFKRLRGRRT